MSVKTVLTSPDGSETLEVPTGAGVRALQKLGWVVDGELDESETKPKTAKKTPAKKD